MDSIFTEAAELFNPGKWPKRPYCTDALEEGLKIRVFPSAIKRAYIQPNPPHLKTWMVHDVDREGAAFAWEDANLAPPSWTAINRANGHAHLAWGLNVPVLMEADDARQTPIRYLVAVEAAYRAALDADPGFSGLITKNPAHPRWNVLRGPKNGYELGELAEYVDLPRFVPKRKPEEVGLGRNVTLFEWLRRLAYRQVRHYKVEVRNFVLWQAHLDQRGLERNGDFRYPLDSKEVWHVAKSVARWTWHRFDIAESDARFSAIQAVRGQRGGVKGGVLGGRVGMESRWGNNEAKQVEAKLRAARGDSQRLIARDLGVSLATVVRWLRGAP